MRFIVYEVAQENVTYSHVVEAESEEAAKAIVLEERTSDQGQWVNTETVDREITRVDGALG